MTTDAPTDIHSREQAADRSEPRRRRRAGDASVDGRGRDLSAAPILSYGFRPFFFLAALYAGLAVPFWVWSHQSGFQLYGPFGGQLWHAHEMIFGFLGAVIAGFILTAVPNWTGQLPLSGRPLALLVALWMLGRIATAVVVSPPAALALDMLFPLALAASVWREVIAGKNLRNIPVAFLLTLFAAANALHHAEGMGLTADGIAVRLALGVATLMISLIGGRIVPSFTRNWLVKRSSRRLPASFGPVDRAALAITLLAILAWIVAPLEPLAGWLLVLAGLVSAARLARWRGWASWREPIVLVLHLGFGWLAAGLAMLGLAILTPDALSADAAIHTLTTGAVGTMTLAVMTRASLGHTGRAIRSDLSTTAIYATASLGALLRVLASSLPSLYPELLVAGGGLWSLAFILFALCYGPILWSRKPVAT
ncbi:NnrS family protein [Mangrovicella endophytica]|uniref:NnrS family protein n=1 Tax=Mangrovicella endophytica TaxID=2066697 RepID=UPI000C9E868F|nr:NnrS family protein [Mangrovicella endophytica]